MTIAPAKIEDLPGLAASGALFFAEGRLPGAFDVNAWCSSWGRILSLGFGTILVARTDEGVLSGAIGCLIHPDLNTGEIQASEAFWWTDPARRGHGIRLLAAFERWAQDRGARRVIMTSLASLPGVGRIYERRGYKAVEVNYLKEVQPWPSAPQPQSLPAPS